ncbi:unnamed protein product [Urochloa decumbens]|uniref:ABC transporter domain-containing protein n=1 Tax=Urochloa decumbens TaxID=240449 RepID=A0ABC8Y1E4_9POAL
MEFHGRHTSLFSQHPNSSSASNEEGPNDTEIEMVADECTNGAADAEEASHENMLLDSSKLGALKRREFFDNLVKCVEDDNLQFLQRQKDRIERQVFFVDSTKIISYISKYGSVHDGLCIVIHFDRVGVKLPSIEVTYENLCVQAESRNSRGNHLPTLWNSIKGVFSIMGLDICADTMVGDVMSRGISGGQKKRLTIAEMIVGPAKAFFMDEISNGLDSSTTFKIIKCFQQLANINECTMLVSLLQPTPEVFDLFDDLILMAEGKIIYHGPRDKAHNFFEECGFRCPERKEMADFLQEEMLKQGYPARRLQLLNSVTGVFHPGVLSTLMGVSGAGKTTLLDVLAGRKTGGYIEGDIRIGGHPKVQETFVRILGYCEQVDIHSPQLTVEESVAYSAWLRLPSNTDKEARYEFVDEVLKIVELYEIKDALVGSPGMNGLSLEQRKRLTAAIELVSNPSVILMDEPTTGLDARSAAIVIRAVKNISETGRTVVCTIHQPNIDIFEAFDEKISGIPKIERNSNPATWIMDVTSTSMEVQFNIDFASIYQESPLHSDRQELVKQLSSPLQNSESLSFTCRFPQNGWVQFKACLWKQNVIYWRSPQYNLNRMVVIVMIALIFGALYWQHAKILNNEQDIFNVLGAMYIGVIQLGVYNEYSIISFSTTERIVMYREKFSGMYSSWAYSFAQAAIEIPYVFIQALLYTFIIYPTIVYYWTAHKLLLFFYTIFCSVLTYTYVGLLFVSVTPTVQVATILGSFFNAMQTLFSGFLLPAPQMPNWWIWLYYLCPTSWILDALLTSQYGSIDKKVKAFGETKSVGAFLNDYYGFNQDRVSSCCAGQAQTRCERNHKTLQDVEKAHCCKLFLVNSINL